MRGRSAVRGVGLHNLSASYPAQWRWVGETSALTHPLAKGEGHFNRIWENKNFPQYPAQGGKNFRGPSPVPVQGTVRGVATGILTKVWWRKASWTVFY